MATIAVTLRLLRVVGVGDAPAVIAVSLPRPLAVSAAARAANGVAGAITLPRPLAVAVTAEKANVGTIAVSLPRPFAVAGAASIGINNTITSISPVLKALAVTGSAFHQVAVGNITLKLLSVAGRATNGITQSGGGAVTLKRLIPGISLVNKYANLTYGVIQVTGDISSDGSGIFQFRGRAGLGVSWSIIVGSGSIAPLGPSYTDEYGLAFGRYDAGGYSGPLTIGVSYVP